TRFKVYDNNDIEKHKYRIVKWEKKSDKNFIVYALDEDNKKIDFYVSIDAYSDLQISFDRERYEAKKSSGEEQKKLNKAIAAREAAEKAAKQKAAKAVVQRGSFSDQRDGKTYKTVKIGSQTWMAENLNYDAKGSKCYGNKPENCAKYGRLYNWATAKNACPSGWHLPSDEEWRGLVDFVGGNGLDGTYLKAKSGWNDNEKGVSGNGTDNYGFSALPGGYGDSNGSFLIGGGNSDGSFDGVGSSGFWWSSTEDNAGFAFGRFTGHYMDHYVSNVSRLNYFKSGLFSVRCLQD
ncbi:MAG: fibrobacter succinogenes major paralogous domain-containing protein, partial [Candidatus Fibromonas sp.]|nr:fibrobacter succinogenes major paralogous domain-containing protein [Candidatus Fibromonas sp.]